MTFFTPNEILQSDANISVELNKPRTFNNMEFMNLICSTPKKTAPICIKFTEEKMFGNIKFNDTYPPNVKIHQGDSEYVTAIQKINDAVRTAVKGKFIPMITTHTITKQPISDPFTRIKFAEAKCYDKDRQSMSSTDIIKSGSIISGIVKLNSVCKSTQGYSVPQKLQILLVNEIAKNEFIIDDMF